MNNYNLEGYQVILQGQILVYHLFNTFIYQMLARYRQILYLLCLATLIL